MLRIDPMNRERDTTVLVYFCHTKLRFQEEKNVFQLFFISFSIFTLCIVYLVLSCIHFVWVCVFVLKIYDWIFSRGARAQHLTLCVMCGVWCVCGVPWMAAILWLVNKTTEQSQSVCPVVQYMCTHNIVMNRAGILAWAATLHGSPTLAISWPAFFENKQCEKHVSIPNRLVTYKPSIEFHPHLGWKDLKYLEPKIFLEPKLVGPFSQNMFVDMEFWFKIQLSSIRTWDWFFFC